MNTTNHTQLKSDSFTQTDRQTDRHGPLTSFAYDRQSMYDNCTELITENTTKTNIDSATADVAEHGILTADNFPSPKTHLRGGLPFCERIKSQAHMIKCSCLRGNKTHSHQLHLFSRKLPTMHQHTTQTTSRLNDTTSTEQSGLLSHRIFTDLTIQRSVTDSVLSILVFSHDR